MPEEQPAAGTLPSLPGYVTYVTGRLDNLQRTPDGWVAACPVEGHGRRGVDEHPSLRVTIGEEGRVLLCCRTGCHVGDVLYALDLRWTDLFPGEGEEPCPQLARGPDECEEADHGFRDRVYRELLSDLELVDDDRDALCRRGLPGPQLYGNGYRTLPDDPATRHEACSRLHGIFGDELFGVPGFRPSAGGAAFSTDAHGLLVPCRNRQGQVVALKVRRPGDDSPRYAYLSGGGVSSGAPVHHPPGLAEGEVPVGGLVRVTEGELKADVATALSGVYTIGLPGVALWARSTARIQDLHATTVRVAFDYPDVVHNHPVFQSLQAFVEELRALGFAVELETWDEAHKGVDDALAAGAPLAVHAGDAVDGALRRLGRGHSDLRCGHAPAAGPDPIPAPGEWRQAAFPSGVLPRRLAEFVEAVAVSKQCPPDFPGVGLLTIAGGLVGSSRCLVVKDDWREKPALYAVIVAEPGSRKTPALKALMDPVYDLQGDEADAFAARAEACRASGGDQQPAPMEHVFVIDTTVEALAAILDQCRRGVLVFRDELTAWVRSMDQYKGGRGTDRQFYLTCWSGESVKVDRKGTLNAPVFIPHPFVSVLGGIQPDLLNEFQDKSGRADGFLDRILFSFPAFKVAETWDASRVPRGLKVLWKRAAVKLRGLRQDEKGRPVELRFTDAAAAAWADWYNAHLAEMRAENFPRQLVGPWAKMEAYCARFALILRLLRWALVAAADDATGPAEVDQEDVAAAVRLLDYFKDHTRGVYGHLRCTREDPEVEKVVEWLSTLAARQATVNEVRKKFRFPTRSHTDKVLQRAHDRGVGELVEVSYKDRKRKTHAFRLNDAA